MENLYSKADYERLPAEQRHHLLKSIAYTHTRFHLKNIQSFQRFGRGGETAVYVYDGSEFVFVPGDIVRLGWEKFAQGMDETTREDMLDNLRDYGVDDLEAYLRDTMSPVRTVKVSPMLVERRLNEIGWRETLLGDPAVWNNAEIRGSIEKFRRSDEQCYIVHESYRLRRTAQGEIELHLYEPVSYMGFKDWVTADGFGLPTENEWEYLCGGGSRTLFRWGDSFDYDMRLRHLEAARPDKTEYDLELPNQFGLEIAYDPYKYEVIDNDPCLKGGDGGCNLCGGLGMAMGYLPVATYFRDLNLLDDPIGYMNDIGGNYTFYRRVFRL